jgi:hypothetical protein
LKKSKRKKLVSKLFLMKGQRIVTNKLLRRSFNKQRIIASFAVVLCLLIFASSVAARDDRKGKRKRIDYGTLEIATTPGAYPILIDGQPSGEVNSTVRVIDLAPGRHTIEIDFPSGTRWVRDFNIVAGKRQCINLNFTPRTITLAPPPPPPPAPCPYPVSVSAPATANDGNLIIFASDIDYRGTRRLNYRWQVTPSTARIVSGQGTPTISVDTTGLGRQRVTATLTVDDNSGDPRCRQTAFGATNIIAPPPPPRPVGRKFDEFPSIAFDDDKARLDQLGIELQSNPTARAYIIIYGGRTSRPGRVQTLATRTRNYLISTRGISPDRLTVITDGQRERDTIEIWILPPGAPEPQPSPTVRPR